MTSSYMPPAAASSSIVDRMRRAAMLDASLYEEVEHDTSATGQAAVVVALSVVGAAVGNLWRGHGGAGLIGGLLSALLGWAAWSGITYLVGTRLFGGRATWGEVLRTVGFAQAPGVLLALRIVPGLGWLVSLVVGVWLLATGFVALRQALDLDTGKTILTVVVGWLANVVISLFFGALLFPFR